ncbi:MAG: M23 family metallopeptidase, partial [Marinirhabdus sp.]
MKTTLITLSLLLALQFVFAQEWGGPFHPNPNAVPCLTETDYKFYHERVSENIAKLERSGKLQQFKPNTIVNFIWPVQAAPGTQYNSVWSISNYVDHDSASNSLSDYNCGTRTYDTSSGYDHQGVDIFTWPFWWKQMEDDAAQIVAAAPGQIIYKNDGSGDRNCSFNNDLWNAVYVQHSDGSVAWYGHMKENSLTGKNVGDTVSQGEVLGIVGSSGNSTGPHLHFEVYDNGPNLIDPY